MAFRFRNPARGEVIIFDWSGKAREHSLLTVPGAVAGRQTSLDPDQEYVKRVIAVGGDEVSFADGLLRVNGVIPDGWSERRVSDDLCGAFALRIPGRKVRFAAGNVLIDDVPLADVLPPSVPLAAVRNRTPANFVKLGNAGIGILSLTVPEGSLFVMGDNRLESIDSRLFGFVDVDHVRGRVILTYWPPSRLRLLSRESRLGRSAT